MSEAIGLIETRGYVGLVGNLVASHVIARPTPELLKFFTS